MRVRTSFGCGRSGARYQNTSHTCSGGASSSTENSCRCIGCPSLGRDQLLDRLGEAVFPGPVLLEMAVAFGHQVVLPPRAIDAACQERGDDAPDVVVRSLQSGG